MHDKIGLGIPGQMFCSLSNKAKYGTVFRNVPSSPGEALSVVGEAGGVVGVEGVCDWNCRKSTFQNIVI